jgi:6-pyruvoyltetrahydropterin/6-carboxytetrahydropterin synthase
MRLGVTETIDCAHMLPGHPKCGQLHGHTYTVEVVVEGETDAGMVLDFADLRGQIRAVLGPYDHRHSDELSRKLAFPFTIRVYEGQGKWAETSAAPRD